MNKTTTQISLMLLGLFEFAGSIDTGCGVNDDSKDKQCYE